MTGDIPGPDAQTPAWPAYTQVPASSSIPRSPIPVLSLPPPRSLRSLGGFRGVSLTLCSAGSRRFDDAGRSLVQSRGELSTIPGRPLVRCLFSWLPRCLPAGRRCVPRWRLLPLRFLLLLAARARRCCFGRPVAHIGPRSLFPTRRLGGKTRSATSGTLSATSNTDVELAAAQLACPLRMCL